MHICVSPVALVSFAGMSLTASAVETRKSQRPYRYGMILLCVGALINWLGLAENYVEPVRYVGVACIIAGALLICAAMCCWLQRPASNQRNREGRSAQVILTLLLLLISDLSAVSQHYCSKYSTSLR